MASPRLPSKLAKIWRKSRSQFQIAGIVNHAKTRAFAGLPGNGPKIYRTDVVPFNFCPRSVMLYVVAQGHENYREGQQPIVHLVSSIETIRATARPWLFTDRHADLGYANQYDTTAKLDEVDWAVMPLQQWGGDTEVKEKRQAEFLVHDWCPWEAIEAIGVIDPSIAERVKVAIAGISHKPRVEVPHDWYY
jgi:hypothetical protein